MDDHANCRPPTLEGPNPRRRLQQCRATPTSTWGGVGEARGVGREPEGVQRPGGARASPAWGRAP